MGESQKHAKSRNVFERFQTFWVKTFFSTKSVYGRCNQNLIMEVMLGNCVRVVTILYTTIYSTTCVYEI